MRIKLQNIVLGNNITGMQIALLKDAVFIPVSFVPAFGWEYINYEHPITQLIRTNKTDIPHLRHFKYRLVTEEGTITVPCFLWELEALYKYILQMSNRLYDSYKVVKAKHYSDNVVTLVTEYGNSFEIEFDNCQVINPDYSWYDTVEVPEESHESEFCHLLYYLILSKDTDDMKGISYQYDIEKLENEYFHKIWYSSLFGAKKFLIGNDPKRKKHTLTTRHICLFIENVNRSEKDEEKYEVAEIRKEIYRLLGPRHKRIADRVLSFDKAIQKVELSSSINVYKNTEHVDFIYYTDKEEIICPKNLTFLDWPQSYPRILISQLKEIMTSL